MVLKIRVGEFKLGEKEKQALAEVIDSGWLSEGKKTFEFEKAWARYIGTKYAVAVNSGTSALIAGLTALKHKYAIKDGSKVITTPVTFIVASLTSVILPSGLIVTRGSRLDSIRLRAYNEAARNSSSIRLTLVKPLTIEKK